MIIYFDHHSVVTYFEGTTNSSNAIDACENSRASTGKVNADTHSKVKLDTDYQFQ